MTTETRWKRILTHAPAPIIVLGDSCVGRLHDWFIGKNPDGVPDFAENKILSNCRFAYSGGASWYNIMDMWSD